jgi:hypothetical protein
MCLIINNFIQDQLNPVLFILSNSRIAKPWLGWDCREWQMSKITYFSKGKCRKSRVSQMENVENHAFLTIGYYRKNQLLSLLLSVKKSLSVIPGFRHFRGLGGAQLIDHYVQFIIGNEVYCGLIQPSIKQLQQNVFPPLLLWRYREVHQVLLDRVLPRSVLVSVMLSLSKYIPLPFLLVVRNIMNLTYLLYMSVLEWRQLEITLIRYL